MSHPPVVARFGREYLAPSWHSSSLVDALALVDVVRRPFSRVAAPIAIPPLAAATIAIAKTDHLGDLVQATALFRALRDGLPGARLVLVHGSWSRAMAEWLVAHDYVHDLVTYDPAWLNNGEPSWPRRVARARHSRRTAAVALRASQAAVFLDIRCTSPHALDLAIDAGVPIRVGFGLRGRGWEYHHRIPFDPAQSLGQNWLHVLPMLGLPAQQYTGPVLPSAPPLGTEAPIIIQPASRTPAKEAPLRLWQALLPRLATRAPLVLIGTREDRARYAALEACVPATRLVNAMGTTTLPELIALVGTGRAVVGVESVGAHLGLGYHRPVVVLNRVAASGRVAFPDAPAMLTFVDVDDATEQAVNAIEAAVTRMGA